MKKQLYVVFLIILASLSLTGCRLTPKKFKASEIEAYAKQYINENVEFVKEIPIEKVNSYAEDHYVYTFRDERGIEFHVNAQTDEFAIVEPIPFLYDERYLITNDYTAKIINCYSKEICDILTSCKAYKPEVYAATSVLWMQFYEEDTSLEEIAKAVIQIDELLALNYTHNTEEITLAENTRWNNCLNDMLIKVKNKESGKSRVHLPMHFSDRKETFLSYDEVYNSLLEEYKRTEEN